MILVEVEPGVRLAVHRTGRGPSLLLHPGLGYASWCWQPVMELLAGDFDVLALDTRGAGQSDQPDGPYSIDGFAADAATVLAALGIGTAHVAGHSMGGYVAQSLALDHLRLVRSLTLVATATGGPEAVPVPEETRSMWLSNAHLPPDEYARATFPLAFRHGWTKNHPERTEQLLAARLSHPTPPERWRSQYEACEQFLTAQQTVESIACPVAVVHGTDDRIVPVENGRRLARRVPQATLHIVEGGGHNLMLEEPETIAAIIRAVA